MEIVESAHLIEARRNGVRLAYAVENLWGWDVLWRRKGVYRCARTDDRDAARAAVTAVAAVR